MPTPEVTLDDLRRLLRTCAGEPDGIDLDGDILDIEFEAMGYDSIARLELAGQLDHELGIEVDDDVATSALTPRDLLKIVNDTP